MDEQKHFKIVYQNGQWIRQEDAEPMADGSPFEGDWTWGIWSVDYGIMPDFYYGDKEQSNE